MNINKAGSSLHAIKTMAAEVTAWLFTITIHLCVVTPCLAQSEPAGSKITIFFVVLKRQRKEFLHKIKSENVTHTILLSRFCFHFCCDFFYFHTFTKKKILFFNIFSLFCKVLCVVLLWLRLILWTVFSFFFCAHKQNLTDLY